MAPESGNGRHVLGREEIVGREDLQYEVVPVPEWKGAVRVRELTGREREEFDGTIASVRQQFAAGTRPEVELHTHKVRVKLCALGIVDEKGERIFKTKNDEDALGRKSARALERIFSTIARLSGLSRDAEEEAGKPSEAVPAAASS